MKSELERRISLLQERAKLVMKVQADHAPFLYVAPWSFMKNECRVEYFPDRHEQTRIAIRCMKPLKIAHVSRIHSNTELLQVHYEV